jgi:hypothetical protein
MSFIGRISKFATSPEGKKLVKQAQDLAKDPRTKQTIEDARERLTHKDNPAAGSAQSKPKRSGTRQGAPR